MKKYLLPETGKFYKANLHCHTSMSDAKYTPEEVKQEYMEKGYSIVGYTDHNVLVDRSHLSDENFLALNGFEMDFYLPDYSKVCHICFIALEPDNVTQICYHRTKYSKKATYYLNSGCNYFFYVGFKLSEATIIKSFPYFFHKRIIEIKIM